MVTQANVTGVNVSSCAHGAHQKEASCPPLIPHAASGVIASGTIESSRVVPAPTLRLTF